MNKQRKYKKGDKVIINTKPGDVIVHKYQHHECKIISLTGHNGRKDLYSVDIPHNKDTKNLYVKPNQIKYYYEKPLKEFRYYLHNLPYTDDKEIDILIIDRFINQEETLTNEHLNLCRVLWDKYNKK